MGQCVGRVVELVGEERARDVVREPRGQVLVVLGVSLAHVGARDVHLGTQRLQVQHLLGRHLVGHDQHHAVALGARDQGQAEPGVAGGRFDHRAARLQAAVALGGVDHREADAVLDGAAGVLAFEFHEQPARASVEMCELDHRRVADEVEGGFEGAIAGIHVDFEARFAGPNIAGRTPKKP